MQSPSDRSRITVGGRAPHLLLVALLILDLPAVAAIIVVDGLTQDEAGKCDLPEAIDNANNDAATHADCAPGSGPDEIQLSGNVTLSEVSFERRDGPTGLPLVVTDITVEGNGFTLRRHPDAPSFRLFQVDGIGLVNYGTLTLRNLDVSNGRLDGPDQDGAGILNLEGVVTLTNVTLSGNSTTDYGQGGGLFNSLGDVTFVDSTISGNSADYGGGGLLGLLGSMSLTNITLSGNTVGTSLAGAGADNRGGTLILTHTTVAGNEGYGVYSATGPVTLTSTVLADNTDGNCRVPNPLNFNDGGNNLADDTTCYTVPATLTGLDPALDDNGGPTRTHALLDGSNAIDNAGECGIDQDQRGAERLGDCDSGAYEFLGVCPDLIVSSQVFFPEILGAQVFENCVRILVGPDVTVTDSGALVLRAGRSIELLNGVTVELGGEMTLEIDAALQLIPP